MKTAGGPRLSWIRTSDGSGTSVPSSGAISTTAPRGSSLSTESTVTAKPVAWRSATARGPFSWRTDGTSRRSGPRLTVIPMESPGRAS